MGHGHHQPQAHHATLVSPSHAPSAFGLVPGKEDTSLFRDTRIPFSHLLPGRPVLGIPTPHDPPSDAVLHLQDAPITVRYRLTPPGFAAPTAAHLAHMTATRWASLRAGTQIVADMANDSWLAAWSVEAAAVASYDVAISDLPNAQRLHEELFVLVKHGMVLSVSWAYPRGLVEDPAYASFAAIAEATLVWDAARWDQEVVVWPDGPFFGPGLYGRPKPRHNESAKMLSVVVLEPARRKHLLDIVSGVIINAGAPWVPLPREVVAGYHRALSAAANERQIRAWLDRAFPEVLTAHDLRGLAIMLGKAIDPRRSSSPPPPYVRPPTLLR